MSGLFSLQGKRALVTGGSRGIGLRDRSRVRVRRRRGHDLLPQGRCGGRRGRGARVSRHPGGSFDARRAAAPSPPRSTVRWTCWSTTPARRGARRSRSFRTRAGTRSSTRTSRGCFISRSHCFRGCARRPSADDPARVVNIGSVEGIPGAGGGELLLQRVEGRRSHADASPRRRLAAEHITVNAIAPGPFRSQMMAFLLDSEEGRAAVASAVPLGRIGSPEDLVGTTTFLCSRAGAYLTGTVIPLDGGITCSG